MVHETLPQTKSTSRHRASDVVESTSRSLRLVTGSMGMVVAKRLGRVIAPAGRLGWVGLATRPHMESRCPPCTGGSRSLWSWWRVARTTAAPWRQAPRLRARVAPGRPVPGPEGEAPRKGAMRGRAVAPSARPGSPWRVWAPAPARAVRSACPTGPAMPRATAVRAAAGARAAPRRARVGRLRGRVAWQVRASRHRAAERALLGKGHKKPGKGAAVG